MRVYTSIIFFIITLAACSKQPFGKTANLRIYNSSNLHFDSVLVNSPGGKHVYYNVNTATFSEYKKFNYLYRYAYIQVHYNNQTLLLQPIDYVGEEKLTKGNYSYHLSINSGNTSTLMLQCKKD